MVLVHSGRDVRATQVGETYGTAVVWGGKPIRPRTTRRHPGSGVNNSRLICCLLSDFAVCCSSLLIPSHLRSRSRSATSIWIPQSVRLRHRLDVGAVGEHLPLAQLPSISVSRLHLISSHGISYTASHSYPISLHLTRSPNSCPSKPTATPTPKRNGPRPRPDTRRVAARVRHARLHGRAARMSPRRRVFAHHRPEPRCVARDDFLRLCPGARAILKSGVWAWSGLGHELWLDQSLDLAGTRLCPCKTVLERVTHPSRFAFPAPISAPPSGIIFAVATL